MINLLPPDNKRQIKAARSNVLLLRYNFLMLAVVMLLMGAIGFTYYYLGDAQETAAQTIADNAQKAASYTKVKSDADAFRQQLSEAKSVLDSQINYSAALLNIAHLIPSGAVVTNLALSEDSFSKPMDIEVNVKGEREAAAVRDNFMNSPLFTNVSLGTVKKGSLPGYPYSITLTVTMSMEAAK